MHEKLDQIRNVMKAYQMTYPEDTCLILADTERIIEYLPGESFDVQLSVGSLLTDYEDTVSARALKSGQVTREERGSDTVGIPYLATASPIFGENNEIVGVLTALVANNRLGTLRTGAEELVAMVEQLSATSEELAKGSQQIAAQIQRASDISLQMVEDIKRAEHIRTLVSNIANQSRLLGFNASIEAARAGDAGRSFGVVAQEIRKMAEQSQNASEDIQNELTQLLREIEQISEGATTIAATSEQHAAGVQEMKAVFEQITRIAEQLLAAAQQ